MPVAANQESAHTRVVLSAQKTEKAAAARHKRQERGYGAARMAGAAGTECGSAVPTAANRWFALSRRHEALAGEFAVANANVEPEHERRRYARAQEKRQAERCGVAVAGMRYAR